MQHAPSVPCLLRSNRQTLPKKTPPRQEERRISVNLVAPGVQVLLPPQSPQLSCATPLPLSLSPNHALLSPTGSPAGSPYGTPRMAYSPCTTPVRVRAEPGQAGFMSRSTGQLPTVLFSSPLARKAEGCEGYPDAAPSPAGPAPGPSGTPGKRQGFEVRDFPLGPAIFDPAHPQLRSQLLAALGASPQSAFEAMKGFHGGMNEGIWFVKGDGETLVLKLVKFDRFAPPQMVEERMFSKLFQELPGITEDPNVAFPFKVFRLLGPNNVRRQDLIVMKKAPGKSLDHIISEKWRKGKRADLYQIFAKVGECLANFHKRYGGRQHNDAGTQNILWDEETQHVTLIDLGCMGNKTNKTDVERMSQVVRNLSKCKAYGPELEAAVPHFQEGYNRAMQAKHTTEL